LEKKKKKKDTGGIPSYWQESRYTGRSHNGKIPMGIKASVGITWQNTGEIRSILVEITTAKYRRDSLHTSGN
jgi:hypothetical protein